MNDPSQLMDRLPPHALEAEAAVLGSIILDSNVLGDVLQVLRGSGDFYRQAHCTIFEALVDIYDNEGQKVDMVRLKQWLADRHMLEDIGGLPYLLEIAGSVPSAASGPGYAAIVRDKAMLRELIVAGSSILQAAYTSSAPPLEQANDAEAEVFRVAERGIQEGHNSTLNELLQGAYDQMENAEAGMTVGVPTGFTDLDNQTGGLQDGDLIIIAGRPSMGKTAFALNVAMHAADAAKVPTLLFSMEMSRDQMGHRLLCSAADVDLLRARRNTLNADEFHAMATAVGKLADGKLYLDDSSTLTPLGLRARARRMTIKRSIGLVVVDYLQLMTCHGHESRQQEVTAISRGLKALARELNVPVICLSQLNRSPEAREGHRPRLSDLRESGAIEQDADVVLLLHRDDYYHQAEDNYDPTNVAEVIVAKQRNGPTGKVKLAFNLASTTFQNLAYDYDACEA